MQEKSNKIAVVLLAAGESSRMHTIKQLLPWGNSTLIGNAIKSALNCNASEVYVVLGAHADQIKKNYLNSSVQWVLNEDWQQGMGASIASSTKSLINSSIPYSGMLIMLCDQPLVDANFLNRIIDAFNNSKKGIVATAYKRRSGVPALFDKKYFSELGSLNKDYGAKDIILKNADDLLAIDPEGKARDLDTMEDYQKLVKHIKL
ncbi:MAG: nucleotidyltransferase family protein [Maribacter sp.]